MATSNDPIFATGVRNFAAKATAAKTTYSDNTSAVLLFTADADGSLVTRCKARAIGTTSGATVLYLFTSPDGGTTLFLKEAILLGTVDSVSTTDAPATTDFGYSKDNPLALSPNERLYCAISVALAAGFIFEGQAEDL